MVPRTLDSPRAIAAVILLFAYNGLVIGVYAASIPILRTKFGLDAIQMGILFVVVGISAVATMQVSGRLADSLGARRVCLAMILPLIIAIAGLALAPTHALLLVAGVFLGMGNGGIDVAMNALAVHVERHRLDSGRGPIMSFFHGMWAIGSFVGSFAISIVGTAIGFSQGLTLLVVGLTAAGIGAVAWIVAYLITPETDPVVHRSETGEKTPIPRAAYLLGLMAIAFGLGEGTANDWSGAHVQSIANVDPRTAAWTVTAMTASMVIIRLTGDFLVTKLGRKTLLRAGGIVAAAGYLTAAFATPFPVLIAAWALVGFGIGVVAPQVFAAAGHMAGGRGLAVVVSFGYTTFLVGPAIISALVHFFGIDRAMVVPGVLLLGLVALVGIALKDGTDSLPLSEEGS
ncbi:MAG: MFS transporter [Propionibacteriaceae bacterium]|jgi:MFS family permease|nr:MFS transporter [Propionibacteriaceae bacterium]